MFFQVWKDYGLKDKPKSVLIETKQLIPDKNLFGQSNAFNVVIQLATMQRDSRLRRQSQGKDKGNQDKVIEIKNQSEKNDKIETGGIILMGDGEITGESDLHRRETNIMSEGHNSNNTTANLTSFL